MVRFFESTPEFRQWLKNYVGDRMLIEIGCGDCSFIREMHAEGFKKMIGIDPRYYLFDEKIPMDLANCVVAQDAEESNFVTLPNAVIIVCRPCHSGFPDRVCDRIHETSKFLYVGLDHNLDCDLDRPVEMVFNNCGFENENCWEVRHEPRS